MKKSRSALLRLVSELEADAAILDDLWGTNRLMTRKIEGPEPDQFDWAALGYTIHNIYNLMENYFLRIARFFENDLDPLSWHRDLVRRMTLDIEDVRPALLQPADADPIDELRSFRHVFRTSTSPGSTRARPRRSTLWFPKRRGSSVPLTRRTWPSCAR